MEMSESFQVSRDQGHKLMLNKVPEISIFFWIIKVLCTTVGETAADFLADDAGLGLGGTTVIMAVLLVGALVWQFKLYAYVAAVYWLVVVLVSIVGTLITDNLVDNFGVPLEVTTTVFGLALVATFYTWHSSEKTLSVHSIVTSRREAFYWAAILFTFALGTSAGDLVSERFDIGYALSAVLFGGLIVALAIGRFGLNMNSVLAFWLAYILTRPFGASMGDLLSQPSEAGGLGISTAVSSSIFLVIIVATVWYLSVSKVDVIKRPTSAA